MNKIKHVLVGGFSAMAAFVAASGCAAAATATAELTNAATTVGDQLQANILGALPLIVGFLAVIIGVTIGLTWIIRTIRRHAK